LSKEETAPKVFTNCIPAPLQTFPRKQDNKTSLLPLLALINVWSLVSKIDELFACLGVNNIDIAAVTETWFHRDIDDELVSLDSYCFYHRDREYGRGGGI
jgi:hypothetical protein